MAAPREVVITGMGVVSPIGIGRHAFAESLRAGRSGVRSIPSFEHNPFPVRFGGDVRDFDGKQYVTPRKSMKVMCREIQFGFASASLAVQDAGLNTADVDRDRLGVLFGSELMYGAPDEMTDVFRACIADGRFDFSRWGEMAMSRLYPLWMLKYLPNMAACHIAIAHDARGPNNTLTMGDASSLLALMEAARCIQRGLADVMIVGGTGSRLNSTGLVFHGHAGLSRRNDSPEQACRPFDAGRDGQVNGEGSGAFVIEEARHAANRGATVLARVLGFGSAFERITTQSPGTGAAIRYAVAQSLRESGISAADIGHVNANSGGDLAEDAAEAQAIRSLFGDSPVTAPKSFFGNLGAGTGAVEMAASILAFQEGDIPRTINYDTPDPRCPVNVVHGQPQPCANRIAVLINQAFTGQAVATVLAGA